MSRPYHRHVESCSDPVDAEHVAHYIDQGLPLLWSCWSPYTIEKMMDNETSDRKSAGDMDAYADKLKADDRKLGGNFDRASIVGVWRDHAAHHRLQPNDQRNRDLRFGGK